MVIPLTLKYIATLKKKGTDTLLISLDILYGKYEVRTVKSLHMTFSKRLTLPIVTLRNLKSPKDLV